MINSTASANHYQQQQQQQQLLHPHHHPHHHHYNTPASSSSGFRANNASTGFVPDIMFSAGEYCDKIKFEFEYLQSQHNVVKLELDRFQMEKGELQQQSRNYFETAYFLNVQLHKQAEVNARFLNLFNGVLKLLPSEAQKQLSDEIESAKRVSVADIEHRIRNQQISIDPFSSEIVHDTTLPSTSRPLVSSSQQQQQQQQQQADDDTRQQPSTETTNELGTTRKKPKREKGQTSEDVEMDTATVPSQGEDEVSSRLEIDNTSEDEEVTSTRQPTTDTTDTTEDNSTKPTASSSKQQQHGNSISGNNNTPKQVRSLAVLPHNHSVSAITFSDDGSRVYTGGRGVVRAWSTTSLDRNGNVGIKPQSCEKISEMEVLKDAYIRSCRLTQDGQSMVICGEAREIVIWDLATNSNKRTMETGVSYHYALILSQDSRHCFSCFSDGNIGMWDLHSGELIRRFSGHTDSVSCIDITPDGKTLVTGSLDKTLRTWDWGTGKQLSMCNFPGQIFTLGVSPTVPQSQKSEAWVAVGLEDSNVEVVDLNNMKNNYQLHLHESCVLSLKFAPNGQWFVTGGKDKLFTVWKAPYGPGIVQTREPNSILCCDVSPTQNFIGTGSWERMATIYQAIF